MVTNGSKHLTVVGLLLYDYSTFKLSFASTPVESLVLITLLVVLLLVLTYAFSQSEVELTTDLISIVITKVRTVFEACLLNTDRSAGTQSKPPWKEIHKPQERVAKGGAAEG